jgi:hypothetical protein
MEKKQTAVEWLFEKLWNEPKDKLTWYAILKQAKEMEKEQIINANRDGVDMVVDKKDFISGEQYYNEMYGKEN